MYLLRISCRRVGFRQNGGLQDHHAVHRCGDQRGGAERDRAGQERPPAVQRHPRGLRQRKDQPQRQLLALRQVHGHQLRLQGGPHWGAHRELPAREEPGHPPAEGGEEFPLILSGN